MSVLWEKARRLLGLTEQRCAACHAPFEPVRDDVFCPDCLRRLTGVAGRCHVCGKPLDTAGVACRRCIPDAPWERCFTVGSYAGLMRECLLRAKFGGDFALLDRFGRHLGRLISTFAADAALNAPCVVPIPLHTSRLRSRGFNQSLEVAKAISGVTSFGMLPDALRRIKDTPTQRTLSKAQRQSNVRGIFEAFTALGGGDAVIVDDVMTTGATLRAAATALQRNGAGRLFVAVVAVDE